MSPIESGISAVDVSNHKTEVSRHIGVAGAQGFGATKPNHCPAGLTGFEESIAEVEIQSAGNLTGVHDLSNQTDALRLVAFVDRLYDAQVRILATGTPLDQVFDEDMLAGGYRKKYLRAVSRLIALTAGQV